METNGTAPDIAMLKKAQEEREDSRNFLQAILSASPVGIFRIRNRVFQWVSESACRMTGYACHELVGHNTRMLYGNDEEYRTLGDILYRRGWHEMKVIRKDGSKIDGLLRLTPMDTHSFVVSLEDVTDRKRLESHLHQAQKMEAIGTLAGGIAHDFNNILTAVIGYSTLLRGQMHDGDPLCTYVDHILSSSQKAADLTRSLLAFSRHQPMTLVPLAVNDVIEDTKVLLKRLLSEDIFLETRTAPQGPVIMGDATQIHQMLINLATNARDAMPAGGVLTLKTDLVRLDRQTADLRGYGTPGDYVSITVSDTGTGMDDTTKEKIFEPFFTTKEVGKGTGLGLSIVYGIVKHHHGYINVYSKPNRGTTFRVYFPAAAVDHEQITEPPPEAKRGSETILVAEDNQNVRQLMSSILTQHGYSVIEAVDGADAVRKYGEHDNIDLLVLDSVMPKMNGRAAYDVIQRRSPHVKTLFMSGYTRDVVLNKGINDKGFNFISKPLSPHQLLRKVREVLDG